MNSVPTSTVERIQRYLVGLRMPRALEALDATLKRFEQGDSSMLEVLETLLGEEFTTRETRRIRMALQTARLGTVKTLAGYDFSFQPSLDRDRIMTLAQLEFIERRQTVHFLGPPGTGKSHLSIALGVEAVRAGKSVYFGSLAEIVNSMAKAEREGNLAQRVRFLARNSLLIVDEIGYLPIGSNGATCSSSSSTRVTSAAPSSSRPIAASANGARSSATPSSQRRCSTGCCITRLLSRLKVRRTGCGSMPISCLTTCATDHPP